MATAATPRAARGRPETESRLVEAALGVFLARGYDAATTGEIARAAGVAAGTFYLYFRDKRAVYERIGQHAAQSLLTRWREVLRPDERVADRVAVGLRLAAAFWRADRARARLLIEGGPPFGVAGHLRFVHDVAGVLGTAVARRRRPFPARALALVVAGLCIEIGRLIVAEPQATEAVDELIGLTRRSLLHLDLPAPRRSGRDAPAPRS